MYTIEKIGHIMFPFHVERFYEGGLAREKYRWFWSDFHMLNIQRK